MGPAIARVGEEHGDGVRPFLLLGLLIVLEHGAHVVGIADGDVAFAGIDALDLEPVVAGGLPREIGFHAFEPLLGPVLAVMGDHGGDQRHVVHVLAGADAYEIEQFAVHQMRWHDVLHRGEDGLAAPRIFTLPCGEHLLDVLALQVFLRTAQVARDDRECHAARVTGDVFFRAISHRADHDVIALVGHQLGRHRLELAAEEHVQEQRFYHVIAMMPQRDLVRAEFLRHAVDDAAPKP